MAQFLDEVRIQITSGAGGDGCLAFLREKFRPKGGPAGGDGGDGGSVIFVADRNVNTLLDYRFQKFHKAKNGEPGRGKNQHGAGADDLVIRVPIGTIVKDEASGDVLHDLATDGEEWTALPGGKGGKGNARFATSTNQAPRKFEPGQPGQQKWVRLELKLLADVGLVGFPNAGKSTLVARVSAARPKVAEYPFTTVEPVLGTVRFGDDAFIMADIPGLIEGAHEGTGLGHRFLRHIERNRLVLFVIDLAEGDDDSALSRFDILMAELEAYSPTLAAKPRLIALSKIDVTEAAQRLDRVLAALVDRGEEACGISAISGEGVEDLIQRIGRRLEELPREDPSSVDQEEPAVG